MAVLAKGVLGRNTRTHPPKTASVEKTTEFRCAGPDPTPADRFRAAIAAGRKVPAVGDVVQLVRAKPRSYYGVELVPLRARVLEQVEISRDQITLNVEVLDDLPEGLDAATASGVVQDVDGPVERREGWRFSGPSAQFLEPDTFNIGTRPCDRCAAAVISNQAVYFTAQSYFLHGESQFSKLCRSCAELVGRLFFLPPPEPAVDLNANVLGD